MKPLSDYEIQKVQKNVNFYRQAIFIDAPDLAPASQTPDAEQFNKNCHP